MVLAHSDIAQRVELQRRQVLELQRAHRHSLLAAQHAEVNGAAASARHVDALDSAQAEAVLLSSRCVLLPTSLRAPYDRIGVRR